MFSTLSKIHCCLDALILWIYTIADSVAHQLCRWVLDKTQWSVKTFGWATGGPEYCASRWTEFRYLGEQAWHLGGHLGIWTFGQAGKVQWDQSDLMLAEGVSSLNSWHPCWLALSLSLSFSFHLNCHCHCEIEIEIVIVIAFVSLPVIVRVLSVEEASWYQASLLKGLGWYLGRTEIDWKEKNCY